VWHKLRAYNEKTVLLLFGIGWIFYSLGISNFGKSFDVQSFFLFGIMIFLIFNFRLLTLRDVKILSTPFACFIIVFILGLLTVFDEVMPHSFSQVFKAANQNTLGYVPLFFGLFLYTKYSKLTHTMAFLGIFILLCAFNVLTMILLLFYNMDTHNSPFFFQAVFT